jgi:hypothetical protein
MDRKGLGLVAPPPPPPRDDVDDDSPYPYRVGGCDDIRTRCCAAPLAPACGAKSPKKESRWFLPKLDVESVPPSNSPRSSLSLSSSSCSPWRGRGRRDKDPRGWRS